MMETLIMVMGTIAASAAVLLFLAWCWGYAL
jgi:hypothetical protein